MFTDDSVVDALIIASMAVFAVVLFSGIGLFVMWIKYSWIRRDNTMNFTGRDMTQTLFNKNSVDVEIRSSFWYSKFWNHNKKRKSYRLRPWTHDRKSLWTMMEASQQAYATIIREKHPKTFWTAFRLPQLISIGGSIIGFGLMAWALQGVKESGISNLDWNQYFKISIGFSVLLLSMLYATVFRAYTLRKNVPPMLEDTGLIQSEIDTIKKIFTFALVYAVANALLQTLRVAIQLASRQNNNSN